MLYIENTIRYRCCEGDVLPMKIEAFNKETLDEVTNLALKLWPDNDWDELQAEFAALLESKRDTVYLAVVDGAYIGFIQMSLRHDYVEGSQTSPVGYIEGIYVDEDHRHKGISRQLVEAGESWSRSQGCREMASDTELENLASQAFHERIGFREAGRIVAYIKEIE